MSGPKSSRYTMTLLQRQMLQEQLRKAREEQILKERKRNEIDVIRHNCRHLIDSVSQLQELITQSEKFANEGHSTTLDISSLRLLCKEALAEVERAEKIGVDRKLEQIGEASNKISSMIHKIHLGLQKVGLSIERQESSFRDDVMKNMTLGFELSFANICDRKALEENVYLRYITEELDKLSELTISNALMEKFEMLKKKADEIKSTDYLENFYSISVVPFTKECREYDELYRRYGEDYRMLCLRYEYLAKELNQEVELVSFSERAISELLEKIAALEAEELRINEEAYICRCIEEAMAEMNYTVIGNRNVTKKNGKQFRNVLYKFDEGTAVNVTYSSNGQITMELGGVDDKDRMPTDEESASLEEDMRSFCDDFYEIEKKLKARGIEPKHISHLPAEAQFAQIINISDFEMIENIGQYEIKKGKRKKNNSTGAALHREET